MRTFAALAAIALISCTAVPQSTASPSPPASAGPTRANPADSKAVDFRTRLDLLLGEHVIIIAKQSSAPTRVAEYTSYLRLLTANGGDLTELVRSAIGDSAAARFKLIWNAQNDFLVSYTIGLVTHNKAKGERAMAGMKGTFVPQFSQFLNDVTQVPLDLLTPLVTQHMLEMKAMLDDQVAKNYPRLYSDLRTAYAHAAQVGDVLAPRIAGRFPDKFPGDASSPAADLRASLNIRWQEHAYLATMRTNAAIGGRSTEKAAAAGALTETARALDALFTDLFGAPVAVRFDKIWATGNAATVAYASASAGAARQRTRDELNDALVTQLSSWIQDSTDLASNVSQPALEAQVEALITAIDDQRSKSLAKVAADDRSSQASTEVVADLVASAVVAKLRARFG